VLLFSNKCETIQIVSLINEWKYG